MVKLKQTQNSSLFCQTLVIKKFKNLQESCKLSCKRIHTSCKILASFESNLQDFESDLQDSCKNLNPYFFITWLLGATVGAENGC